MTNILIVFNKRIYNKFDFSNIDMLMNDANYLRKFIVNAYRSLYGLDDIYVQSSLEKFDDFFKER